MFKILCTYHFALCYVQLANKALSYTWCFFLLTKKNWLGWFTRGVKGEPQNGQTFRYSFLGSQNYCLIKLLFFNIFFPVQLPSFFFLYIFSNKMRFLFWMKLMLTLFLVAKGTNFGFWKGHLNVDLQLPKTGKDGWTLFWLFFLLFKTSYFRLRQPFFTNDCNDLWLLLMKLKSQAHLLFSRLLAAISVV